MYGKFIVLPFPNLALNDVGASCLAWELSVGPRRFLHWDTALSPINSKAITGPLVTKFRSLLKMKILIVESQNSK